MTPWARPSIRRDGTQFVKTGPILSQNGTHFFTHDGPTTRPLPSVFRTQSAPGQEDPDRLGDRIEIALDQKSRSHRGWRGGDALSDLRDGGAAAAGRALDPRTARLG